MNVLVLGATGDQGAPQVVAARAAGHRVRAASRDATRTAARVGPGVECVDVDYRDPATVEAAVSDIEVVLANFPSSSFNDGELLVSAARTVAGAARRNEVGLVVFNTSLPQRDRDLGLRAHDVRRRMREAFEEAGVPLTVLCPVVFMGNLLRGWAFPHIVDRGRFVYPHAPTLEVSWICQEDLAALMVAAAERPALAGNVFAVGGPQALRGPQVAAILTEAVGRSVEFVSQPVAEFCAAMRDQLRTGTPAERDRMISELDRIYRWYNESPDAPFKVDMGPVLDYLPVRLTPLRDWAQRQRWSRGG